MIVPPLLRAIASPHRAVIEAAFGRLAPDPGVAAPPGKVLFLCFTNRCGSNYLAQLLASTGVFNEAGEFFNAPTVLEHAAARGLRSLGAYMAALPGLVPPHRALAAKAGADQLVVLADAGILDALAGRCCFLLLERRDHLAQAVSRVIAAQTGRWTALHRSDVPSHRLVYDRAAIAEELDKIARANAAFYLFFAVNGIVPVHTTYEAVLRDPQPVADEVAAALVLGTLRVRPDAVTLSRQSTTLNTAWIERFQKGE